MKWNPVKYFCTEVLGQINYAKSLYLYCQKAHLLLTHTSAINRQDLCDCIFEEIPEKVIPFKTAVTCFILWSMKPVDNWTAAIAFIHCVRCKLQEGKHFPLLSLFPPYQIKAYFLFWEDYWNAWVNIICKQKNIKKSKNIVKKKKTSINMIFMSWWHF